MNYKEFLQWESDRHGESISKPLHYVIYDAVLFTY